MHAVVQPSLAKAKTGGYFFNYPRRANLLTGHILLYVFALNFVNIDWLAIQDRDFILCLNSNVDLHGNGNPVLLDLIAFHA